MSGGVDEEIKHWTTRQELAVVLGIIQVKSAVS